MVLSSKKAMYDALSRCCDGQHEHCPLEGTASGLGRRTSYMEDYQPHLASVIAGALVIDEKPQQWEYALAVGDRRQLTGKLIKLRAVHAQSAVRVVQRLHRNLGHPTTEQFLLLLESRGASHQVPQAARDFTCVSCQRYRKPNSAAPAAIPTAKDFNRQVQADVLWIKDKETKYPVLSMVDVGTRFQAVCLIRGESSEFLIGALEKYAGSGILEFLNSYTPMKVVAGSVNPSKTGPLTRWLNIWWHQAKLMNVWDWLKEGIPSSGRPLKCIFMIWVCLDLQASRKAWSMWFPRSTTLQRS